MHILLLTNPVAGHRTRRATSEDLAGAFADGGWEVTCRATTGPGGAADLAREGASEGFDAVFACGGDGTLSEIVRGLLGTGVPAGIVPTGTGNDFARTIGLSLDPIAAVRQHLKGAPARVDLLNVDDGRQWAINVMGVGFDAGVARRVNSRTRLTGGLFAYLSCVCAELVSYRPVSAAVVVDGAQWRGDALLIAIANARSYGAGMMIAPHAEIDDGLLDVVVVEHMSRANFLVSFPRVMRGTHLSHPAVHTWRGREAHVETDEPSPVLIDGDLRGETPVKVRVAPGHATLWMPGGMDGSE